MAQGLALTSVKNALKGLNRKVNNLYPNDIPREFQSDESIIEAERALGLRYFGRRGYDILRNDFFIEEWQKERHGNEILEQRLPVLRFENFKEYYECLSGDIYTHSSYYKWVVPDNVIMEYNVELPRLNFGAFELIVLEDMMRASLAGFQVQQTADLLAATTTEKDDILYWWKTISSHQSFEKIKTAWQRAEKNEDFCDLRFVRGNHFVELLIQHYPNEMFPYVVEKLNSGGLFWSKYDTFQYALVYGFDQIKDAYLPTCGASGDPLKPTTMENYRREAVGGINQLEHGLRAGRYAHGKRCGFRKTFGLFYVRPVVCDVTTGKIIVSGCAQWFFEFDDFAAALKNDLSGADLADWHDGYGKDFSQYIVSESTQLPLDVSSINSHIADTVSYRVCEKKYDASTSKFVVAWSFLDAGGQPVGSQNWSSEFFSDFVCALRGDLSGADLTYCTGLENIGDWSDLDVTDIRMSSAACESAGVGFIKYNIKPSQNQVVLTEEERCASLASFDGRLPMLGYREMLADSLQPVCYISDMHLTHKLHKLGCRSEPDIKAALRQIAKTLCESCADVRVRHMHLLVFVGDTCDNFQIFCWFLDALVELTGHMKPVFIPGNHEVFGLEPHGTREVVKIYREAVESHDFYFLYNDLLCVNDEIFDTIPGMMDQKQVTILHESELQRMSVAELRAATSRSRLLLLGATGFSHGHTASGFQYIGLDRGESYVFDAIYEKCVHALYDRPVIVATHTPFCEWHELPDHGTVPLGFPGNKYLQQGFIYVSGHTHQNYRDDDGAIRVYADNQSGYDSLQMKAKWFYVGDDVDIFSDYGDGIYQISRAEYLDFCHGKNFQVQFNRDIPIYMLKKNGCYAFFIRQSHWCILNGGTPHKIKSAYDIQQLYDRMDDVINTIKAPFHKFMNYLKSVSNTIKSFGGVGYIHGCIIDIDYYNHIFINPFDGGIMPYFALDIREKIVYQSVPALLENQCPQYYAKYRRLEQADPSAYAVMTRPCDIEWPVETAGMVYTDTSMYSISRIAMKMQKLKSQVLTLWPDTLPENTEKRTPSQVLAIRDSDKG